MPRGIGKQHTGSTSKSQGEEAGQSGMLINGTAERRNRRDASCEGDKGEIIRSFLG